MGLRMKVFSGFVILAAVLFVAGAWSIYEVRRVGPSVQRTLDEGHAGTRGGRMMIEALEREDAGALLLFLERDGEGREVLGAADSLFEEGFRMAVGPGASGEVEARLAEVRSRHDLYRALWTGPIRGSGGLGDIEGYLAARHSAFADAMAAVTDFLDANDRVVYETAMVLRSRLNRAIMPGVVAVVAAFVFTLIFYFFVNFYVVSPVVKMHEGIQRFLGNNVPFDVEIETNDEIADLARGIQRLCARIEPAEGPR